MLNIIVPSSSPSHINFTTFEEYELPAPPSGVDAEVNNDLILKFEDEEEAVIYAEQLESMLNQIDDKTTPQFLAVSDIITAIRNDEFVQGYIQ